MAIDGLFLGSDVVNNVSSSLIDFESLSINVASPEKILSWSFGQVKHPDTINYRTYKPEKDGLFCARIFGPIKDYECLCGKYRRRKYKGIKCEKCEVEVTSSKVRRERMGHINLAYPAVNILYLKSLPSKIATLLETTNKDLEKIIYFEKYIVVEAGNTSLSKFQTLTETEYRVALDDFGNDAFRAEIGSYGIQQALASINLQEELEKLSNEILRTKSELKLRSLLKKHHLIKGFIKSNNKPEWMVIDTLPVMPPELRPLVPLEGGKWVISDLNLHYTRILNRNTRLQKFMDLDAPELILRNERIMLQDAVNCLLNNSANGQRAAKNSLGRPLKSISDFLKGKQGRFRQNLLGKRVDYSGRSVIVVGPELRLHECGLPKKMALELFKPFVVSKLKLYGKVANVKNANGMIMSEAPEVWDILESVIREHPVLLNRAPTLHKLGIQAFEPKLIESKAIQLHPLVCRAFNADFDGDQMAVHIPLSLEAQVEARILMMSSNNIISPANGSPVIIPRKDITAGLYYATTIFNNEIGENKTFYSYYDVLLALENKVITINTKINYCFKYHEAEDAATRDKIHKIITSAGRIKLFNILPQDGQIEFENFNFAWNFSNLNDIIQKVYDIYGPKVSVIFCDKIMTIGFHFATVSGLSIGKDDIIIPGTKQRHIDETMTKIKDIETQYLSGYITQKEKFNKVTDYWAECTNTISRDMMLEMKKNDGSRDVNSIVIMMNSGARASETQMRQLAGMRGLIVKPSGGIIETPVTSNFKEGLNVFEYFNSAHGARKGNVDTALKTADAGYLTRRLVDVAQDCIVTQHDCGSTCGITYSPRVDDGKVIQPLSSLVFGRITVHDIVTKDGKLLLKSGELITKEIAKQLDIFEIPSVEVRSVVTCNTIYGVCSKCYGLDLSTNKLVSRGEAIGIVAAQSIGEPGTQLTLNTFHVGGAASKNILSNTMVSNFNGIARVVNTKTVTDKDGKVIVVSSSGEIVIYDKKTNSRLGSYRIEYSSEILIKDGQEVSIGDQIAMKDQYNSYIIAEHDGIVEYNDIIRNVSFVESLDSNDRASNKVLINWMNVGKVLKPSIAICNNNSHVIKDENNMEVRYYLSVNTVILVNEKQKVSVGDKIARIPREGFSVVKDITGGLPRVEEIFEARIPKDSAVIASVDGYIELIKDSKVRNKVILHPADPSIGDIIYNISKYKTITFRNGAYVKKGDTIVEGNLDPHDILLYSGISDLTNYITSEIHSVYKLQGIDIDNKHVEIIIKCMLSKVVITDVGDSNLQLNHQYDLNNVLSINNDLAKESKNLCKFKRVLYGITKISMQTESFIAAASFQETMKVLTDAAVEGRRDHLRGMKENIIIGRLIPAGTGFVIKEIKNKAKALSDATNNDTKPIAVV